MVLYMCPAGTTEKERTVRKKLLTWAAIGLGAWWIFTQPKPAAHAVGGAFGKLGDAADSVVTFLTALFT